MGGQPEAATDGAEARGAVAVLLAVMSTVFTTLPPFLLGALAIYIRQDLRFDEQQLGIVVSAFHLAAALMAVPGGRLGERWGASRGMVTGVSMSCLCVLLVATVANHWVVLALLLSLGGVGNAISQPAANLLLARMVSAGRQGLAFGAKQAAIPASSMLAGLSVPLLGATVGWRWAFVLAAMIGPVVALTIRRLNGGTIQRRRPPRHGQRASGRPSLHLLVMATAGGLAISASSVLGPFFVESGVAHGLEPQQAGAFLAAASLSGILARAGWGWVVDRFGLDGLSVCVWLMLAGSAGLLVYVAGHGTSFTLLMIGSAVMFTAAWGWNGLLTLAIVQRNMHAPAAASGVAIAGFRTGGILGPIGFGTLVTHYTYPVAWSAAAAVMGVAALLLLVIHLGERARRSGGVDGQPERGTGGPLQPESIEE